MEEQKTVFVEQKRDVAWDKLREAYNVLNNQKKAGSYLEGKFNAKDVIVLGLGKAGIEITKHLKDMDVYFVDSKSSGLQFSSRKNIILLDENPLASNLFNGDYMIASKKSEIEALIRNKILILCCGIEDYRGLFSDVPWEIANLARSNNIPIIGIVKTSFISKNNPVTKQRKEQLEKIFNSVCFFEDEVFPNMNYLESANKLNEEIRMLILSMVKMLRRYIVNSVCIFPDKLEFYVIDNILDVKEDVNKIKSHLLSKKCCEYKCKMVICAEDIYKQEFYEKEIRKIWQEIPPFNRERWDSRKVRIIFLFYK